MRVIAIDYGRVNTGVAVSDPTGTVARPLEDIRYAADDAGLRRIRELVRSEAADLVLVGMPVSLSGEVGKQAQETREFMETLSQQLALPVVAWDERFTSKLAASKGRYSKMSEHSIAACCLLEDYLGSQEYRRRVEEADTQPGNGDGDEA